MSEPTLTVPTAFVDISQLAEGLADRVDEGRLMLYGPEAFEEGAWIRFAVLLADQNPALEGVGRVVTSIDGGEERPEVARWDVVLDSLQLEGTGEVVYERILMVRSAAFGDQPQTGEVSLDEMEPVAEDAGQASAAGDEFIDESTAVAEAEHYQHHVDASAGAEQEAPAAELGAEDGGYAEAGYGEGDYAEEAFDDAEATMVAQSDEHGEEPAVQDPYAMEEPADGDPSGYDEPAIEASGDDWDIEPEDVGTSDVELGEMEDISDLPAAAPPPTPPQQPDGFQIAPFGSNGQMLSRPSRGASWYPEVVPPPDPRPSSGLFAFAGGLPVPPAPPRPDLDPSLRIQPAPRPQNGDGSADHAAPAYEAPMAEPFSATDPSFATPEATAGDSIPVDADLGGVGDDELYDPEYSGVDIEDPDDR